MIRKWGQRDYFSSGPGVNAEATPGSSFRGSRSWASMPGAGMLHWPYRQRTHELRTVSDVFRAAHYVGVEKEYCHMERLANLDQLPSTGVTVCAFPLKVKGGSADPTRAVAMIDEVSS